MISSAGQLPPMPLPDLIVGGAPKCGTSSFFGWLTDHPGVCGSVVKETFHLMDAGHPLAKPAGYPAGGLDGYAACFAPCAARGQRVAEATTHYLYQDTARDVLSALRPQPDVIFLLRSPAERVYSSFQYTRNNLSALRPDATFAEFLAIGESGGAGIAVNAAARRSVPLWSQEVEMSRYVVHLRRWAERFPRGKLHVYLFEDLREDARGFMQRAAAELGLDPSFYDGYAFPRRNESYAVRNPRLQRLGRRAARFLPAGLRTGLRDTYLRTMTRPQPARTPEDAALVARLAREFAPWNEMLAREFAVDVSAWASGTATPNSSPS